MVDRETQVFYKVQLWIINNVGYVIVISVVIFDMRRRRCSQRYHTWSLSLTGRGLLSPDHAF